MSEAELHILRGRMLAGGQEQGRCRGEEQPRPDRVRPRPRGRPGCLTPTSRPATSSAWCSTSSTSLGTVSALLRYSVRDGIRSASAPTSGPDKGA